MAFLQNRPQKEGTFYEIMMPYGAYLAVRMNAELGTAYDELKMLNWCFDGNNSDRDGWGVRKAFIAYKENTGCQCDIKLYEEDRHEILNENNRKEIFEDILAWLRKE